MIPALGGRFPPSPGYGLTTAPSFLWRPQSPITILIPPGQTVRLSPPQSLQSSVTLLAEVANTVAINISNADLRIVAGVPTGAYAQLVAGADGIIYTDDPFNEKFDLGVYFAAHIDPVNIQRLYMTVWNVTATGEAYQGPNP